MFRPRAVIACLIAATVLAGCIGGGRGVFVPQSDYPIPPKPRDYTQPGDCRGGSRLAALDVDEPDYPRRAYKKGLQGWVALRLDVDEKGRPRKVRVIDSLPKGPFDAGARSAVRKWRFQPPGEPGLTRCVVVLDYRFGVGRIGF
ncbi:MAG: energy transducer TonB [Caulobacterales bacterium]|nr:energy transducer TonB [Caulobacterales bacterium]